MPAGKDQGFILLQYSCRESLPGPGSVARGLPDAKGLAPTVLLGLAPTVLLGRNPGAAGTLADRGTVAGSPGLTGKTSEIPV